MTQHGTRRAMLAPLLVMAFALVQMPQAMAFERQDIVCELEDLTRFLSLRVDPDAGYVCDVLYRKPDEGNAREVLWSARNNVDYCKPRFDDMVEQLASRGWTCDYADEPLDTDEPPAMGGAKDARADDDEASSEGATGKFRDWCIADVAGGESVEGTGSVKDYCNCVADGMKSHDLTEEDAQVIFEGLSAMTEGGDKRLNTLAANYETVVESCR